MHLLGGAVWIGGLIGLLLLALPGGITADRGAFSAKAIRRFSVVAMTCVGAITVSGLFLYWQHVDGPEQLFTTMYGRVLGVKLLIFGTLMVLAPFLHGSARNQAFQAEAAANAANAANADAKLPKIAAKEATTTTWLLGTGETALVVAIMVGGYRVSGKIAERRVQARTAVAAA